MESEAVSTRRVIGIRYPLSRDPIFIEVSDTNKTIENVLLDTVAELEKAGKSHEAFQLQQSITDHVPFVKVQQFARNSPMQELPFQEKFLEGEQVKYAELNLLKEHVGGN